MSRQFNQILGSLLGLPRSVAHLCRAEGRRFHLGRRYPGVRFAVGANADDASNFGKGVSIHQRANIARSIIGDYSYIGVATEVIEADIGKYCSIGAEVRIGLGIHPVYTVISTFPGFYSRNEPTIRFAPPSEEPEYKRIRIGHDVWIGARAMIMDGVTIGSGAVVGAGAIVTRDVGPYEVVAGVPAKLVRKRFEEAQIRRLLEIAWWDKGDEFCRRNAHLFLNPEQFFKNVA